MVAMATFSLLWLYLANSQVSVYRTIGTLVSFTCWLSCEQSLPFGLLVLSSLPDMKS